MNVQLPNGVIIEDVPDNISKAELDQKLRRNGLLPQEPLAPLPAVEDGPANPIIKPQAYSPLAQAAIERTPVPPATPTGVLGAFSAGRSGGLDLAGTDTTSESVARRIGKETAAAQQFAGNLVTEGMAPGLETMRQGVENIRRGNPMGFVQAGPLAMGRAATGVALAPIKEAIRQNPNLRPNVGNLIQNLATVAQTGDWGALPEGVLGDEGTRPTTLGLTGKLESELSKQLNELFSVENAGIMAGSAAAGPALGKLISAYFGVDMTDATWNTIGQAQQQWASGDKEGSVATLTGSMIPAYMAAGSFSHLMGKASQGQVQPQDVRLFMQDAIRADRITRKLAESQARAEQVAAGIQRAPLAEQQRQADLGRSAANLQSVLEQRRAQAQEAADLGQMQGGPARRSADTFEQALSEQERLAQSPQGAALLAERLRQQEQQASPTPMIEHPATAAIDKVKAGLDELKSVLTAPAAPGVPDPGQPVTSPNTSPLPAKPNADTGRPAQPLPEAPQDKGISVPETPSIQPQPPTPTEAEQPAPAPNPPTVQGTGGDGPARFVQSVGPFKDEVLVTPSAKKPGKWQATLLSADKDGNPEPTGDAVFNTREEAIRSAKGETINGKPGAGSRTFLEQPLSDVKPKGGASNEGQEEGQPQRLLNPAPKPETVGGGNPPAAPAAEAQTARDNAVKAGIPAKSLAQLDQAIADKNGNMLVGLLHTGNKHLRAVFTEATGITLPKTEGGSRQAIRAWEKQSTTGTSGDKVTPQGEVQQDTAAAAPVEEGTGTTEFDPAKVPVQEVPISQIALSKDVPNFKEDADPATGVVRGQQLAGSYQRVGTAPIVLWKRANGQLEIITGRHRLDLAKRTGETTIPAQIVDESQGFTKDMALTFDAEANIRDGQGEVKDYAHYFRNRKITEEEARARGLLGRAKANSGWHLGKNASDDLYSLWEADRISTDQAVAIARTAPGNAAAQRIGSKYAVAGKSPLFLENLIRSALAETGPQAAGLDLFGADDSALKSAEKKAEVAARFQRDLQEQITAGQSASRRPEAAKKLGINVKDPTAVQRKIAELKQELARWQNWPTQPDLMAKVNAGVSDGPGTVQETGARYVAEPPPGYSGLSQTVRWGGAEYVKQDNGWVDSRTQKRVVNPTLSSALDKLAAKQKPVQQDLLGQSAGFNLEQQTDRATRQAEQEAELRQKSKEAQEKAKAQQGMLFEKPGRYQASNATIVPPSGGNPNLVREMGAYHGTRHHIDQFKTSEIGTGEGHQVYGWGLYFAENKAVADTYAQKLGGNDGKLYRVSLNVEPDQLLDWDKPLSEQPAAVRKALADNWLAHPQGHSEKTGGDIYEMIARSIGGADPYREASQQLHEVGIHGIRYLDQGSRYGDKFQWDTSRDLSAYTRGGNAQAIESAIKSYVGLAKGDIAKAVEWLEKDAAENGQAEQFPDSGNLVLAARALKNGDVEIGKTRNYVVFDENKIRITHNNGQEISVGQFVKEQQQGNAPKSLSEKELAAVQSHVDSLGLKDQSKKQEAVDGISRALQHVDQKAAEASSAYQPGLPGLGDAGSVEQSKAVSNQGKTARLQPDQDTGLATPGLREKLSAAGLQIADDPNRASSLIHRLYKEQLTWEVAGTKIQNPADAYALLYAGRSPFNEAFRLLILSDDNVVVGMKTISLGSRNGAIVEPEMVLRALEQFQTETGKKYNQVIASHNHPSGDPTPSSEDLAVTKRVANALNSAGYHVVDHLITNGNKYVSLKETGVFDPPSTTTKGQRYPRNATVRSVPERPSRAPWETQTRASGELQKIDAPQLVAAFVSSLRQADPDSGHVLYLTTKNGLTALERIPNMRELSTDALWQTIAKGITREGAASVIVDFTGIGHEVTSESLVYMRRLMKLSDAFGVPVLDALHLKPEGGYASYREMGLVNESASGYGKEAPPVERTQPQTAAENIKRRLGSERGSIINPAELLDDLRVLVRDAVQAGAKTFMDAYRHVRGYLGEGAAKFAKELRRLFEDESGAINPHNKSLGEQTGSTNDPSRDVAIVKSRTNATLNRDQAIRQVLEAHDGGKRPVLVGPEKKPFYISQRRLDKMTAPLGETAKAKPYVRERIAAIQSLDELAENSVPRPPYADTQDPVHVARIHEFVAPFQHEGSVYRVRLLGKEFRPEAKQLDRLHSLAIEDVILERVSTDQLASSGDRTRQNQSLLAVSEASGTAPQGPRSTIKLGELLGEVNPSANTIVTEQAKDAAVDSLKKKLGRSSMGVDPTILKELSTIGGYHIEKGVRTFGAWSKAMIDELGDSVRPFLRQTWNKLRENPEVRKITRTLPAVSNREMLQLIRSKTVSQTETTKGIIQDSIGGTPETLTLKENEALANQIKAQERGAKAGFKAGIQEGKRLATTPPPLTTKEQIAQSIGQGKQPKTITEGQALAGSLAAQEKASAQGYEAGRKETAAKLAAEFKTANFNAQTTRDMIVTFAKGVLPPEERGRYLQRVANAKNRLDILEAFRAIDQRADEIRRRDIVRDIQSLAAEAEKPGVALESRQAVRVIMDKYGESLPGQTTYKLTQIAEQLQAHVAGGRATIKAEQAQREADLRQTLDEITTYHAAGKFERWESLPTRAGVLTAKPTIPQSLSQRFNRIGADIAKIGRAIAPVEVVADWMDGTADYNGPLHRAMIQRPDVAFNEYLYRQHEQQAQFDKIATDYKLQPHDFEGLQIYATARQGETGLAAIAATLKEVHKYGDDRVASEISKWRTWENLSPGQQAFMREWDKFTAANFDRLQAAHRAYDNTEIKPVENYSPMQRRLDQEPDVADSLRHDIEGEVFETKRAMPGGQGTPTHGYTIERVPFSDKPLKFTNFGDAVRDYIKRSEYFIAMAPDLRQMREVVTAPEFKSAVGNAGRDYWVAYVDLLAKNGKAGNVSPKLDAVMRNVAMARLLWRGVTAAKQIGALIPAVGRIGLRPVVEGGWELATNVHARQFLHDHAGMIRFRDYREPAKEWTIQQGFSATGAREKLAEWGATPMAFLDKMAAASAWMGSYFKHLDEQGIRRTPGEKIPFNRQAWLRANIETRRSQGSSSFKDIPMATSRGYGLSDSRSLNRALFQFQNYMLSQWATLRHDSIRDLARNRDVKDAVKYAAFFALAGMAEAGISYGYYKAFPKPGKDDDTYAKNASQQMLGNLPFLSNVSGMFLYDSPMTAAESSFRDAAIGAYRLATADEGSAQAKGAIRMARGVGSAVIGIPGMVELSDQAMKLVPPSERDQRKRDLDKLYRDAGIDIKAMRKEQRDLLEALRN